MQEIALRLRDRVVTTDSTGFIGSHITPSPANHILQAECPDTPLSSSHDADRLRQLAAGIAHDYNNLFLSMLCGTTLALENLASDHPARSALEIASGAVERAAELTRQLMAYAGIGPFVVSQVDLSALVRKVIVSTRPFLPQGVHIVLDLAANLHQLCADSTMIERLLRALIANAVEAISDDTEGVISIRTCFGHADNIAASGDRTYIHIYVRDTGCGMDEWTRRRIFEPFFSAKFLGRGLGLAAVAGIVRSHQGTIEVYSTPGAGSTFHVCLPAPSGQHGYKECIW
jgi:signal transduction histidine kinase